jgi:hypothetical protein
MKTIIFSSGLLIAFILFGCSDQKQELPNIDKTKGKPSNTNIIQTINSTPATFGFEKGMRSQCPTTSTKRCCGRKFCIVTPISKIDEDYDMNANVTALDYM